MWYLIVSIPDLCTLTYLAYLSSKTNIFNTQTINYSIELSNVYLIICDGAKVFWDAQSEFTKECLMFELMHYFVSQGGTTSRVEQGLKGVCALSG